MKILHGFASFSVDDLKKAKEFYSQTLGLECKMEEMGIMNVKLPQGEVMIYPKPDHSPASFTVLNLIVKNIDEAVDELTKEGVEFEQYDNEYIKTNEKGIADDGENPKIAWFKDPAGNILSIIEQTS